jgi:hypothetical protein
MLAIRGAESCQYTCGQTVTNPQRPAFRGFRELVSAAGDSTDINTVTLTARR